jgi:IS5 family transposase
MGGKQLGFGEYEQATARKRTKREPFLAQMEAVVPWKALIDLIEPYYPKTDAKGGLPPYPLATLLRIHLMQQVRRISDPAMEDALIEEPAMRCFAGINLISDRIPAETTILSNFLRRNAMRSTRRQPGLQILRRLAGGDGTAAA